MHKAYNIDKPISKFTSTGEKLIFHPEIVKSLIDDKKAFPISLQVAPTSICNLACSFCSNANRDKHESLNIDVIHKVLFNLKKLGLKTVEWTGGGDPTMYEHINEAIAIADTLGLKQGFITNGIALKKNLTAISLSKLYWVRISMNCLDYISEIDIPNIYGTLGFSYVMNDDTNPETLDKIQLYANEYNAAYIRVVPNCQATYEEQEINNTKLSVFVKGLGKPWFFQPKSFEKPEKCHWGYIKPFLLHDGWVYPCSSIVLNDVSQKKFHEKFRWFRAEHLLTRYSLAIEHFNSTHCNKCVFTKQNVLIQELLDHNQMRDFV